MTSQAPRRRSTDQQKINRFRSGREGSWEELAGEELGRRFESRLAPLIRAVLTSGPESSTLLLSMEHCIADGKSAALVLSDLTAALNGRDLEIRPTPTALENLTQELLGVSPMPDLAGGDPRLATPTTDRPFTDAPAFVRSFTLDSNKTASLIEQCRTEQITVHSHIVAVAAKLRAELTGEPFVRVLNPVDFRPALDGNADVAIRFGAVRIGIDAHDLPQGTAMIGKQTSMAKSIPGIAACATVMNHFLPPTATTAEVVGFMNQAVGYEMMVSNLGQIAVEETGPIRPRDIWGPMVLAHIPGEQVIGVATYDGVLRVTVTGHENPIGFTEALKKAL